MNTGIEFASEIESFSAFLSRRLVLENMSLVVVHPTSSDLSFHSSLFKMQTDHLSFERFEELFEGDEDETPVEPSFDSEWSRCEVSASIRMIYFGKFPTSVIVSESVHACEPTSGVRCRRRRDGVLPPIHSNRQISRLLRSQVRGDDGKNDFERRRSKF